MPVSSRANRFDDSLTQTMQLILPLVEATQRSEFVDNFMTNTPKRIPTIQNRKADFG
jgi:hypothetical protein